MLQPLLAFFGRSTGHWPRMCGNAIVSVPNPGSGLIRGPSIALLDLLLSFFFLIFTYLFCQLHTSAFASFRRGWPPARHTKVVDHGLGPLMAGSTHLCAPVCDNDMTSLKPTSVGQDVVDDHMQTNKVSCAVCCCGSVRCKTCMHVSQGSIYLCE